MSDQVDEVKQKTDIVSVIGESVALKKAGRNFKGNCPFHTEKTPSFMVSPELQMYKCFGCSEAGDVFTFLQKQEGMDFPETLKVLAEKAGVKLKPMKGRNFSEKEVLYETVLATSKFYQYILLKHPMGKRALEYLKKDRGLSEKTIKEFKLGFSPKGATGVSAFFLKKKKKDPVDFVKAGILIKGRGGYFDRFGGRVIFPLFDHRGNPIGFAGRLLPEDKRDLAKYINSPETLIYHKSNVLYGLDKTRSFIKQKKEVVVVEGELDLISSWEAGVKNVIATKGTALTAEQVKLLSRFTEKLVLALDSDFAGNEAALRGMVVAQNEGLEIMVAKLGKYKDPDDAAKKDPSFYKKAIKDATDVWEFVINFVLKKYDTTKAMGKARASKEISFYLSMIKNKVVLSHYVKVLADRLSVPEESILDGMSPQKNTFKKPERENKEPSSSLKKTAREIKEERILYLFFQNEGEMEVATLEIIKTSFLRKVLEEYKKYTKRNKNANIKGFSRHLSPELKQRFFDLIFKEKEYSPDLEEALKEAQSIILALEILEIKEKLKELARKMKEKEGKNESTRALTKKHAKLSKELFGLKKTQEKV